MQSCITVSLYRWDSRKSKVESQKVKKFVVILLTTNFFNKTSYMPQVETWAY